MQHKKFNFLSPKYGYKTDNMIRRFSMFELKIVNVINSEFAVSPEEGESIFNLI